jgi:hypothetical protein
VPTPNPAPSGAQHAPRGHRPILILLTATATALSLTACTVAHGATRVRRGPFLAGEAGKYAAVTLLRAVLAGYKSNPPGVTWACPPPASAADAALSLRW